jgi:uncharacterized protein YbjT (DUF2867 family)
MRVLVTGATGFIGGRLVEALLARGYQVQACARAVTALADRFSNVSNYNVDAVLLDVTQPLDAREWHERLQHSDVVINTVGIIAEAGTQTFDAVHVAFPRHLFEACVAAPVSRVIHLSALGADANATTPYHQSKFAAEQHLLGLELDKVIVKPSLVFGARGQSTAFFRALAAQPVQVLIDHGTQRIQPIVVDDLIAALIALVTRPDPPEVIAAVGPVAITFREMLEGYKRWLDRDDHASWLLVMSVPYSFALAAARLVGVLRHPFLNADNIRMLQRGNTADPAAVSALLGTAPAAFAQALRADPATEADRWHARLYFLLPLLRWAIAFVWLYTGIISALVYPVAESYAMLQQVGISGWLLPVSLYGAALLDIALGLAWLLRFKVSLFGSVQLAVITGYTMIISVFLPEFWFHPFGPLLKNVPLVVGILIVMAVERK